MKAIEQYFYVVLFIMLYKVVLTFESVYDHSNENVRALLSCGADYNAVHQASQFKLFCFLALDLKCVAWSSE